MKESRICFWTPPKIGPPLRLISLSFLHDLDGTATETHQAFGDQGTPLGRNPIGTSTAVAETGMEYHRAFSVSGADFPSFRAKVSNESQRSFRVTITSRRAVAPDAPIA